MIKDAIKNDKIYASKQAGRAGGKIF